MILPENLYTLVLNLQRVSEFMQDRRARLLDANEAPTADIDPMAEQGGSEDSVLEPVRLKKAS